MPNHFIAAAEVQVYDIGSNPAPWTAEEQKLLEQAMRTYPATIAERLVRDSSQITILLLLY